MDNTQDTEISLQDIVSIVLRKKMIIIIFTAVGLLAGLLASKYFIKPLYTSEITLYIDPSDKQLDSVASELSSFNYAKQLVNTYIELLKTKSFYEDVEEKSSGKFNADFVKDSLSITSIDETELIKVTVTTDSAATSYSLAELIGQTAPDIIIRIMGVDSIKIADPPLENNMPSNESTLLNTAIGALLGLVASAALVIFLELIDIRIKDEEELRDKFNLPVLGGIIDFNDKKTIKYSRTRYYN